MKKFMKLLTDAFLIIAFGISSGYSRNGYVYKNLSILDNEGYTIEVKEIGIEKKVSKISENCTTFDTGIVITKYDAGEKIWEVRYDPYVYSNDLAYVMVKYYNGFYNEGLVEKLRRIGIEPIITGEQKKRCKIKYRGECVEYEYEDNRRIYPEIEFWYLNSYEKPMALTIDESGNIYLGVISRFEIEKIKSSNIIKRVNLKI